MSAHADIWDVAVIGGGPGGLRAAEAALRCGGRVVVFEKMPSVGRKFLVAGRGGLNISNTIDRDGLLARYSGPSRECWQRWIAAFPPDAVREWMASLGVTSFVGSGKRLYPQGMKSAPLLRRWVECLRGKGVTLAVRHQWQEIRRGEQCWELDFSTPGGTVRQRARAVVFAMGGASWSVTGSDGAWGERMRTMGLTVAPWQAANCGWSVSWTPEFLAEAEGLPLKNVKLFAGEASAEGELMVTDYGLEGGPLYALTPHLRAMQPPVLHVDLKPVWSVETLRARAGHAKCLHWHEVGERWRLSAPAIALLRHHPMAAHSRSPEELAPWVKSLPLTLLGPRPLDEAISSAGGVSFEHCDERLMLRDFPGVFLCGEMLDWEAPTGGFLMQGCLSMGEVAGASAGAWAQQISARADLPKSP